MLKAIMITVGLIVFFQLFVALAGIFYGHDYCCTTRYGRTSCEPKNRADLLIPGYFAGCKVGRWLGKPL